MAEPRIEVLLPEPPPHAGGPTVPRRRLTKGRLALALGVAVVADVIQLPLNLVFFPALASVVGAPIDVPIETVDIVVDLVAAGVTTALLGFHWALLPTAVLEVIPGLDALPTWTACVMFVAWRRHAAEANVTQDA